MRELKGDWRDLFNGFMVALDLRKCFLALCGIVVTVILCGGLTIVLANKIAPEAIEPPTDLMLHKWWNTQMASWDVIYSGVPDPKNAEHTLGGQWIQYVPYTIGFVFLFLVVWSYFGGAIARIAAYEIAKDGERIETRKALQFSRKKFWSFFWAPLICMIGFLFFAFCNYAGGLLGGLLNWLHIGAPLVALLLPFALLSGFIMALIAVGTFTGFPLFAPAVAAEGTDSFDAVSRGFSYVYSRPWHYVWYQAVSWAYGYVCIGFVILFAVLMCHLGIWAGGEGFRACGLMHDGQFQAVANESWRFILSDDHQSMDAYRWEPMALVSDPHPYGRLQTLANQIVGVNHVNPAPMHADYELSHQIAAFIITLWLAITLGLALGYSVSFFFSQQTMIYYILRKKVDGIEMNEVFEETEEEAPTGDAPKPEGEGEKKPEGDKPAEASKSEDKPADSKDEEKKS